MRDKPKHTQLLPLFLGQPLLMTVLVLLGALAASVLFTVGTAVVQVVQTQGVAAFLPSGAVVRGAVLFGIAFGLFNIACESAELDMVRGNRRPGFVTYSLLVLSLAFVSGSAQALCAGTFLTAYASVSQWGLIAAIGMAFIEVALLQTHFARCRAAFVHP
jgi:hypothetical protein